MIKNNEFNYPLAADSQLSATMPKKNVDFDKMKVIVLLRFHINPKPKIFI